MQLKLIFCITRGWSYPNIDTTRKSLMPSSIAAAANGNAEMTCHTVRRSRATASRHLQTSFHPQVTTINVQNVATQHIEKGSHAQQKSTSAGVCHKFGHLMSQCFQKKQHNHKMYRQPKAHQIQIDESHSYIPDYSLEDSSAEHSFCLQVKIPRQNKKTHQSSNTTHLITNIVYKLKPHHNRNRYLWVGIDTGAEVNLMPVSVYKLIYQDNDLCKLSPCNLKIGTYTADTINIICTMVIYLIHPDSKRPTKMTFHIASSEGSVLLSCNTSLQLGLIHHRPRLNYLPPRQV